VQAGFAVGIDLGTSNTVAVLRQPDGRTRTLLFDGQPILPSAAFLDTGGKLHVGRDAQRLGLHDPARFEPNPKRRIDDGTVFLGDAEVPVVEIFAEILRTVGAKATEACGGLPVAAMTHPAAWGGPRRDILRDAAARAGWGQVRLVPEPVAAVQYFTAVVRQQIPVGSAVGVFDFGGGTLDIAVVRRDQGVFTVLGSGGIEDLGGLDFDHALVEHLGKTLEHRAPEVWQRLREPQTHTDRRDRRLLWDDVRAAKEMLSRTAVAPVSVPGLDGEVHLTREEFETLAAPLLQRAVRETTAVVSGCGLAPGQLVGVFLVGGASRIPLVARELHAGLGLAPTVLEQPELPVAEGALVSIPAGTRPGGPPPGRPPVRPIRPAPGVARPPVAAPMGGLTPTMPGRPVSGVPGRPISGQPMSGPPGRPVSGQPVSAMPVSAMPAGGLPVSAPPGPVSGPPMRPPPQPPRGMARPPGPPFGPPPRPRRRWKTYVVLATVLATVAVVGIGIYQFIDATQHTFQQPKVERDIPITLTAGTNALAAIGTKTAFFAVQQGRTLQVTRYDMASWNQLGSASYSDAARWSKLTAYGDLLVAESDVEGSQKTVAVINAAGKLWEHKVGSNEFLTRLNNGRFAWLDRAGGKMHHLSEDGTDYDPPIPLATLGRVVAVSEQYVTGVGGDGVTRAYRWSESVPSRQGKDVVKADSSAAMLASGDLYVADPDQTGYTIKQYKLDAAGSTTTPLTAPWNRPGRKLVTIFACGDSTVCSLDQAGTDAGTAELYAWTTGETKEVGHAAVGGLDLATVHRYADALALGHKKDGKPATTVMSLPGGKVHGPFVGTSLATVDVADKAPEAMVMFSDWSAKNGPVTLTGIDVASDNTTDLGSLTLRPAGCGFGGAFLACPTDTKFTVWRVRKV